MQVRGENSVVFICPNYECYLGLNLVLYKAYFNFCPQNFPYYDFQIKYQNNDKEKGKFNFPFFLRSWIKFFQT